MKYLPNLILLVCCLSAVSACQTSLDTVSDTAAPHTETARVLNEKRLVLPNGWALSPAGTSVKLGDFPLNMAVSANQQYLAVTNNGQSTQSVMLMDAREGKVLDEAVIAKAWLGIHFGPNDQSLYVSAGNDNAVKIYNIQNNKLSLNDSIVFGKPWPNKISVAGIDLNFEQQELYAVTKEDSALYIANLQTRQTTGRYALPSEAYTCLYDSARQRVYVSLWGNKKVAVFDLKTRRFAQEIPVESHPNDMVMTRSGRYLFVANANANSVSVIDLNTSKVIETISAALYADSPTGSTTNSLALSADEHTLYIANADNNCLAVFDVSEPGESKSLGFIPTEWYPTTVRVVYDQVMVANGKGGSSQANPNGPNPYERREEDTQYIARLFKGTLSLIDEPDAATLAAYTEAVYKNTPYDKATENTSEGETGNPIPTKVGDPSPIKYVFYIIKENRTYDQVFGDMPQGNGDSSLCLFPEKVTPNHHKLAREFVLLDNFYVNAEVSADGHNWSMAAYATDYVEKTWPTSYGGRGGTYDYEGTREIAYPEKGYIWDYCQRAGVSYRSYGEFAAEGETPLASLEGHIDEDYPGYDLSIKDVYRFEKWKKDFDSLLAINAVPRFQTMRFGNDHTAGARLGTPTPAAYLADNDLALGRMIEHLSKSKIWKESVVFALEDDAQNGPDHVDAHRSLLLIAGGHVKRKAVVHTMYSTASVLRTIELILGLPPMSQYDAAANSLWECFMPQADTTAYTALPNNIDLNERNTKDNKLSRRSAELNLTVEDAIPDTEFSEIIWKTVRGEDSPMPPPRKSAFVFVADTEEEE